MENESINIKNNLGSPIVTGSSGNIENRIGDSFNTYTEQQKQSLAEAATEIQVLLQQLEQTYSVDTTTGKMTVATEAIKQIEHNPQQKQRIFSALKAGGVSALEQLLNHPATSFFIAALEDWQTSKPDHENSNK